MLTRSGAGKAGGGAVGCSRVDPGEFCGPVGCAGDRPSGSGPRPRAADGLLAAEDGVVVVVTIRVMAGSIRPRKRGGDGGGSDACSFGLELAEAVPRAGEWLPGAGRGRGGFLFRSRFRRRMSLAREAGAGFCSSSLHADALGGAAGATGASIYNLAEEGTGAGPTIGWRSGTGAGTCWAGLDLTGQDDEVAAVLMDLARIETAPEGLRLAEALVEGLRGSGARLNSRPRREAVPGCAEGRGLSLPCWSRRASSAIRRIGRGWPIRRGGRRFVEGLVGGILAWADEEGGAGAAASSVRRSRVETARKVPKKMNKEVNGRFWGGVPSGISGPMSPAPRGMTGTGGA